MGASYTHVDSTIDRGYAADIVTYLDTHTPDLIAHLTGDDMARILADAMASAAEGGDGYFYNEPADWPWLAAAVVYPTNDTTRFELFDAILDAEGSVPRW